MQPRLLLLTSALLVSGVTPAWAGEEPRETVSAFAREQSSSPVKWLAWGDEAFKRARQESKPLYVTIGAFTSELSRAMARQSFANPETAAFLNENFVCVLVDRDEQPALAALYRTYLRTTKQLEGWPLNVWLTPELVPIEGATYLPPSEEWGKPGFMVVAKQVASAWKTDAEAQRQKAKDAVADVQAAEELPAPSPIDSAALDRLLADGAEAWRARYDAAHGGFGEAPKLPEPELLRFLLRQPAQREMALRTLGAIVDGGMRDHVDGGFFKQTTDAAWRLPYLQKTLADQARLVLALLDAAKLSKDPRFAEAAVRALRFVLMFFGEAKTGFSAAHDATGEKLAASYLWSIDELSAVLGDREARTFARVFGATAEGNIPADAYPGVDVAKKNLLYRAEPRKGQTAETALAQSARKLMIARHHRLPPRVDPNATAGAHGLFLAALARASVELREAHFRTVADHTVTFIRSRLRTPDGGLLRIAGRDVPAAPEDYAFVIDGLLALHEATGDADALAYAKSLRAEADRQFFDAKSGRYFALRAGIVPGMWARVHAPTPGTGELPSAEAAMAIALTTHKASAEKPPAEMATLIAALAAEVRDAAEAPRGELLFALQSYRQKSP